VLDFPGRAVLQVKPPSSAFGREGGMVRRLRTRDTKQRRVVFETIQGTVAHRGLDLRRAHDHTEDLAGHRLSQPLRPQGRERNARDLRQRPARPLRREHPPARTSSAPPAARSATSTTSRSSTCARSKELVGCEVAEQRVGSPGSAPAAGAGAGRPDPGPYTITMRRPPGSALTPPRPARPPGRTA
jgi:hypothetical protein